MFESPQPEKQTESSESDPEELEKILRNKEKSLFQEVATQLRELPEQIHEKSRNLGKTAALSFLLGTSTAFAQSNDTAKSAEQNLSTVSPAEQIDTPKRSTHTDSTQTEAVMKKVLLDKEVQEQIEDNPIIDNLVITLRDNENREDFYMPIEADMTHNSIIANNQGSDSWQYLEEEWSESRLFNKVPLETAANLTQDFLDDRNAADNAAEYFDIISERSKNYSPEEKIYFLSMMGSFLGIGYDEEMSENDAHAVMGDDAMFRSLQNPEEHSAGVCGNIHSFMTKSAHRIGIDAWIQTGIQSIPHAWMGTMIEHNNQKEIVFVDYQRVVATGTADYQKALGIMERANKNVSALSSHVATPTTTHFNIASQAQQTLQEAAGIEEIQSKLLEQNDRSNDLEISLSPDKKGISLSRDHLGITYTNYKNTGNPYNSLEEMHALRGEVGIENEHFNTNMKTTVMHMDVGDLEDGTLAHQQIIADLSASYINQHQFTAEEAGKFITEYSMGIEVISGFLNTAESPFMRSGARGTVSLAGRIIYITPEKIGKFYIDAQETKGIDSVEPIASRDLDLDTFSRQITAGSEVKVHEGTILGLDAAAEKLRHGHSYSLSIGVNMSKVDAAVSGTWKDSDHENFMPAEKQFKAELGYQNTIGELNIYGIFEQQKYAGTDTDIDINAGLKLKIYLHR